MGNKLGSGELFFEGSFVGKKRRKKSSQSNSAKSLQRISRPQTLIGQVELTLRRAIAEGQFPDDRLPTAVELAEQLGVSRETVRLALDSLQEEGLLVKYRRRGTFVNASSVPTKLVQKSNIVGYLQADYSSEFGESEIVTQGMSDYMLNGALTAAGEAGFHMVARSARVGDLRRALDDLRSQVRLRGVVFASIAEEKLVRRRTSLDIPVVLLDHDMHVPKISSVRPDGFGCIKLAVKHLAELGHRRIGLIGWHQQDLNPWVVRGYRDGMRESGLRCRRVWETFVPINRSGADQAIDAVMQGATPPSALVCFNNPLANFVIDAAADRGIQVPKDLSVIGGGGGDVLGLTCIEVDWHDLGRQAMELLLSAINDGENHKTQHKVIPFALQPGRTTTALQS